MIPDIERTADQSDLATQQEQLALQSALVTSRKPEGPAATMECLFCGAGLDGIKRWCDADCRDGWEREQRK